MKDFFSEISDNGVYKSYRDREWRESSNRLVIEVRSPVDNGVVGRIQSNTPEEVARAIEGAKIVQKEWEKTPLCRRVEILLKTASLLEEQQEEIAQVLCYEVGKPIKEARDEVSRTVDLIAYYAEEGRRLSGEVLNSESFPGYEKNKTAICQRVALGVIVAISPFNYPINEGAPKICAALVTGNTCVWKPGTQGAISALHLAQVFHQAGVPQGVLQVVTGRGEEIGDILVSHPLVSGINLTGSVETAERVTKIAGIKKLVFGLSGKDASLVFADADLDLAAKEIASGSFSYAGQRCTGIKRVLVEEKIADEFVEKLAIIVKEKFVLGDPRQEKTTLGPMVNDQTALFVRELIKEAEEKGAKRILPEKFVAKGRYLEATILDYVMPQMRVAWEEPFGPVLPIIRVKDEAEMIKIANQSAFGLQSSVFTCDINRAFRMANLLEVGTVQINAKDARGPDHFPFLGIEKSGLGTVQGAKYLIQEMTRWKVTVINHKF